MKIDSNDLKKLKIKTFFETRETVDYAFFAVILFYLFLQFGLVSSFNSMPSPLYGGDYYFQLGNVNHIYYGGNWFGSSNVLDSEPGYLPLYSILAAGFSKISGLEPMYGMFYFSLALLLLSLIFTYLLLAKLFSDKKTAILGGFLYFMVSSALIVKYSKFSGLVMMPIYFYFLVLTFEDYKIKNALILGLILGLIGISHTIAFLGALGMLVLFALYFGLFKEFSFREMKIKIVKGEFKKVFMVFVIVFIIGFVMSLFYLYRPLFVHGLEQSLHYIEWNGLDFSNAGVKWDFLKTQIKNVFFNFGSIYASILSLLAIFGLILFSLSKKNNYQSKALKVLLIGFFIATFHYFITMLFGTNFYPERMTDFMWYFFALFLICYSLKYMFQKIPSKHGVYVLILLLIIVGIYQYSGFMEYKFTNRWLEAGRGNIDSKYLAMNEFIINNTDINDVFLSSNELGFALNSLTGRKLLTTRRAQNSPFLDMDERVRAGAAILYGNNDSLRRQMLEKYNIKYLYWDSGWLQTEYQFNEKGIVGKFDPLLLFDSYENENFLNENGIKYFKDKAYVDPAMQGKEYKEFDLLFILPNMRQEHPWNDNLDKYLKDFFIIRNDETDEIIARVYEVNI